MHVICAIVHQFPVALVRRDQPDLRSRPVLVARSSETRGRVAACSRDAAEAGVVPGMHVSRALALSPNAAVVPLREETAEREEHAFVALATERFPRVEAVDPGHIHADVRGMARLARLSPDAYLARVQSELARESGLPVLTGGASTVFAAHAAASYLARPTRVLVSTAGGEIERLPVDALPVSPAMLQRLDLFGITTLGQIGALSPSALQAQFGPEGLFAWKLVHGEEQGRINPGRDELRIVEHLALPAPAVQTGPLVLATDLLLQRALRRKDLGGRAVRRADWTVELENEERLSRRFVFREPNAERGRMLFLIRHTIERLELPAPALSVELILSGICSEYARQERLFADGPRGQAALSEAVEQLTTLTGHPQLYRVVEVEPWSRIPERQRALAAYSP